MVDEGQIRRILRLYPEDCQPQGVERLAPTESFSGAMLWRVAAPRGPLCLRRWPSEHPNVERLQFVQAVLWHVVQEGFTQLPLPLETNHHHGFIRHDGHLWELAPWLPGAADYRARPGPQRLYNAMVALARFHQAARSFPLAETGPAGSPGMAERVEKLRAFEVERFAKLGDSISVDTWPELADRGARLLTLARATSRKVLPTLETSARLDVALQPCIRDVWHPHVLFVDDEVSGIVDFGSMRPDNVATDVARLLGSLAGDEGANWRRGLAAYQSVRKLSEAESSLVTAFDRSTVLMGGLQWLEWVYLDGRQFSNRPAVLARVDEFLGRLERLAQAVS